MALLLLLQKAAEAGPTRSSAALASLPPHALATADPSEWLPELAAHLASQVGPESCISWTLLLAI